MCNGPEAGSYLRLIDFSRLESNKEGWRRDSVLEEELGSKAEPTVYSIDRGGTFPSSSLLEPGSHFLVPRICK